MDNCVNQGYNKDIPVCTIVSEIKDELQVLGFMDTIEVPAWKMKKILKYLEKLEDRYC
jgi:hypothetical protein